MPAVYSAADVLVLPSDGSETWGLVANEALACGLPVILSDAVGSAPDLAGDGTAGLVFPLKNIDALANSLYRVLYSDPPSIDSISAKSSLYSLEKAVDGILCAVRCTRARQRAA
jgi:glycosyltransferase involved in cell wall biosynthesis